MMIGVLLPKADPASHDAADRTRDRGDATPITGRGYSEGGRGMRNHFYPVFRERAGAGGAYMTRSGGVGGKWTSVGDGGDQVLGLVQSRDPGRQGST